VKDQLQKKYKNVPIKIEYIKNNQNIANYNVDNQSNGSSFEGFVTYIQKDPIILIIPKISMISHRKEMYLSNGNILFPDNMNLNSKFKNKDFFRFGAKLNYITDKTNIQLAKMQSLQQISIFSIVMAIVLLIFCGIVLSIIFCNKNSQMIFIKKINGKPATKIFGLFIFASLIISLFAMWFSLKYVLPPNNKIAPLLCSIIIILNLVALTIFCLNNSKKIVATTIKRY
jgi:hypothetical protein